IAERERPVARAAVAPAPRMHAVAAGPGGPSGPGAPGVVQRTETVRVTTRTIVDPDEDRYGRRYADSRSERGGREIESRHDYDYDDRGYGRPAPDHAERFDDRDNFRDDFRDDSRAESSRSDYAAEGRRGEANGHEVVPRQQSDFEQAARQAWSAVPND